MNSSLLSGKSCILAAPAGYAGCCTPGITVAELGLGGVVAIMCERLCLVMRQ